MKNINEIAIIFQKGFDLTNATEYFPIKIVSGYYDEEKECFIDALNNERFSHIIKEPEDFGFAYRMDEDNMKKQYPIFTVSLIKKIIFNSVKKYSCFYVDKEYSTENVPVLLIGKSISSSSVFSDQDVGNYYYKHHKRAYDKIYKDVYPECELIAEEKEDDLPDKKDINLLALYEEITKNVIDQDEPIKKILTAIWKHYSDFSNNKSRNILINGSTGVGKTETFRILSKLLDVPIVITSATEYTASGYVGKSVDDMLSSLINAANGDLKKAERGILVIDEIDKLSENDSKSSQVNQRDVQEALLKILEDGIFEVEANKELYTFDTKGLLVVGMGSWSRVNLEQDKVVGFEKTTPKKTYKDITREEIVKNGIIPELIGRFPVLVQMNELNFDSFVKILKSKNNIIELNKKFFHKQGIELVVDDSFINIVAKKADKNNYGARGLDEIIERALSVASFEIACNPEKYAKLIVDENTIEDNKKYVLVNKN